MREFDHIGFFNSEPREDEFWVESLQAWVTNARIHPWRLEYIRFKEKRDPDRSDIGRWKVWNMPHVAYRVDDLEEAISGEEVVLGPIEPADWGRAAFIHKDGAILEYLEYSSLDTWFGQATPWRSTSDRDK
ncbi:MAG: hypothetical protein QF898_20500 [SAR202 cluster bacterium]|jgi:hypothetical protein|nr:hypothetical protein [SAR202 cluster bacterium]MDP6514627.1 hypothetical protein [SAR202 cluster bacterium]